MASSSAATNPAVTEVQILNDFLLSRAKLRDIITLTAFTELFPAKYQSHPQVLLLYRELELLRNQQCKIVHKNIKLEQGRGKRGRSSARRQKDVRCDQQDVIAGIELFGAPPRQPIFSVKDLNEQMERATKELEARQRTSAGECEEIYAEMEVILDDTIDLRYGKFSAQHADIDEEVVQHIKSLVQACDEKLDQLENEMSDD